MTVDYSLGLIYCGYAGAGVAALITTAAMLISAAASARDGARGFVLLAVTLGAGVILSVLSMFTGLGAAAILYPPVNLLMQTADLRQVLIAEVATGVAGLRLVTILLAARAILFVWRHIHLSWQELSRKPSYLSASGIALLPDHMGPAMIAIGSALQTTTLLLVVFVLWGFLIAGLHDSTLSALNFLLFFFVDDWLIMSDFLAILKGRLSSMHSIRIVAANLAIGGLVPLLFYRTAGEGRLFWTACCVIEPLVILNTLFATHAASRLNRLPGTH